MAGSSDAAHLMALMTRLLGTTRAALAAGEAAGARARFDAVRAAIERLAPAEQGGEPADPRQLAADVGALRGALVQAGVDPAAAGAGQDMAQLGQVLRSLIAWLESPSGDAGRDVDSLVAGLEKVFGPMGSPGAEAARAERDERLRIGAQAAISERLRQAGIKSSDDP
jgi:hypothetical protein